MIPSVANCRGGPSVAALAMARELRAQGVECEILTTDDDGPGRLDVPSGEWCEFGGARVWFLPRWSPRQPRAAREYAVGCGLDAWLDARMGSYDILHVHALFSHLPSRTMMRARRAGRPYVLRPLGLLENYSLGRSRLKKWLALAVVDRANVRGAAALHWTSERECEVSSVAWGCPGWVVPLGIDAPAVQPAREIQEVPTILYLSRWAPKKRIDLLLAALGLLRARPWRLVLAGGGGRADGESFEKQVRAWVAGSGFADRVEMPGFLENERKADVLAHSDLFVLPSESENFGIAVAEAMAWGLPCVVTRGVALARDIQENSAGWVSGEGVEELASALSAALTSPQERKSRGRRGATYARSKLSWSACARRIMIGYREICAAAP